MEHSNSENPHTLSGSDDLIINPNDCILVTGANGFIGAKVVEELLVSGFMHVRCFVRPSSNLGSINALISRYPGQQVEIFQGNLLSRKDCQMATEGVAVVLNLATGNENSFAGCFMNSVLTLRNLLDAVVEHHVLKRFLHVSSFAVYSNLSLRRGALLDETCPLENRFMERAEAYCYGKAKQEELLKEYAAKCGTPYAIVRPGAVFGPGKSQLTARIGIDTFGIFLHLGGRNQIPFTYVDNCAKAIVLAGLKEGVDGEVFNIVDDDLPDSRTFLREYQSRVGPMRSITIPYWMFYILCYLWESYSERSHGQLPPVFNRRRCAAYWKGNRYSNKKLKSRLGWKPKVSFKESMRLYFNDMTRSKSEHA
ncbi:MAG: NAD-dependent epimerase/dehydratase family protein [Nitrospira sp.]|nr:NAD-dependent epimerase/dehydratase family protein [Nitrospira sp.]